jgi:hypothetical protein
VITFAEYERHTTYCGSKTKKCLLCNRNVCLKDEDMHNYGGECETFREEEKAKREADKAKMEAEERKKRLAAE